MAISEDSREEVVSSSDDVEVNCDPARAERGFFDRAIHRGRSAVGGLVSLAVVAGCADQPSGNKYPVGTDRAPLVDAYQAPTPVTFNLPGTSIITQVIRSGASNVKYRLVNDSGGKFKPYETISTDGGKTRPSVPTQIISLSSASNNDTDFSICDNLALVVQGATGRYATWSDATGAGTLTDIPGISFTASVTSLHCKPGSTKVIAAHDGFSIGKTKLYAADTVTGAFSELTICNPPIAGFNTNRAFISGNDLWFDSDRTGTLTAGQLNIFVFNNDWTGTNCKNTPVLADGPTGIVINTVGKTSAKPVLDNMPNANLYFNADGVSYEAINKKNVVVPPVEAGPPDSGENDSGIPLASCKTINVTENPQNVRLFDCDDTKGTFHGKILGPAKYTVGSATDEVKKVQPKQASDFSQTDGRHMHFGDGVLHRMIENEPDPNKKKTVNQWGDVTGLEGTDEEWNQPDDPALNPPEDIANGVTRIISEQNRDGHVRNHPGATCPAGSDVAKCPTDESFAPGGELANGIIYTEYVNGKRGRSSVNKADFAIKAPIVIPPVVQPPPEKKPGCGCTSASQGIHQTRLALSDVGDLAGDFGVVAVGGFLTVGLLRKKEGPKPKKDKGKEENMAA